MTSCNNCVSYKSATCNKFHKKEKSLELLYSVGNTVVFKIIYFSRNVGKRTFGHLRPAKILIRFFTERILDSQGCKVFHSDNEYSDQTARMCRLICVFVGRACQKVLFIPLRLIYWLELISLI